MVLAIRRLAAPLLAALALAGCASSGGKGEDADKKKEDAAPLPDLDRPLLYQRVNSLTQAWASAWAGTGEGAAAEARSLETAIAHEVWTHLDEILDDLRSSENPRWRAAASRGLGFVAHERVRPALEKALSDADKGVLNGALVSLARMADVNTDDRAVSRLLTFPDLTVQGNAALCLARVFHARRNQDLPVVVPSTRIPSLEVDLAVLLFRQEDPVVRGSAAQALGALGSPYSEDALLNVLRDEHTFVRVSAAHGLAQAGTRRSLDFLLDALAREQEKNVKTVLALAVGAVSERAGHVPPYAELKTDAAKWRQWLQK